jgi:flavin reductase (DIM6/NTAB) family NADH-FMN oxidoreductase RutF
MRKAVELSHAFRLVNHGPVTLVSAAHDGKENVMAVAWCMALDFKPPKLAVVLAEATFTRELVDASGELVVQVPPKKMLDVIDGVGNCTGRDVDKWSQFSLTRSKAAKVKAPLVDGCLAWLECKVVPEPSMAAKYDLFVVEVVAAWADDDAFENGRWREDLAEPMRSVHHVAGGSYVVDGKHVRASRS